MKQVLSLTPFHRQLKIGIERLSDLFKIWPKTEIGLEHWQSGSRVCALNHQLYLFR